MAKITSNARTRQSEPDDAIPYRASAKPQAKAKRTESKRRPEPQQQRGHRLEIGSGLGREITDDEAQAIKAAAIKYQDSGAICWDDHGPYVSVRHATVSERALARGSENIFRRDNDQQQHLVVIDRAIELDRPNENGDRIERKAPLILSFPTSGKDAAIRNAWSAAFHGFGCIPAIGPVIESGWGAAMAFKGARLAMHPETREEGLASMRTGVKHALWGAFSFAAVLATWGAAYTPITIASVAMGSADLLQAAGSVATKQTPKIIDTEPPTDARAKTARTIGNAFSGWDYVTEKLAGTVTRVGTWLGGLFHKKAPAQAER